MIPPRIKNVIANNNYELIIEYQNGEKKLYNIQNLLEEEYYKKLKDLDYFLQAKNSQVTIEWPDGEDIDPNRLYEDSIIADEK